MHSAGTSPAVPPPGCIDAHAPESSQGERRGSKRALRRDAASYRTCRLSLTKYLRHRLCARMYHLRRRSADRQPLAMAPHSRRTALTPPTTLDVQLPAVSGGLTTQTTSKVRLAFVLNDAPSLHRNDAAVHDGQGTVLRAAPPPASQHHTHNRCLMRRSAAARSAKPVYRHTATMSTTRRRQNAHLCVAHDTHSATSRLPPPLAVNALQQPIHRRAPAVGLCIRQRRRRAIVDTPAGDRARRAARELGRYSSPGVPPPTQMRTSATDAPVHRVHDAQLCADVVGSSRAGNQACVEGVRCISEVSAPSVSSYDVYSPVPLSS
ncbi:hypothetical protein HYPSUDRAFT_207063 [Hypholoma sublateritium FD-334 SS-4]|uniref:Uncharacterized protein n=1 Tax=Hypholoma sublateritium (strain FD-334 SS-4) TaxID=945553 RepID=A0A0D2NBD7_HYPSF|nr:hypothetical protein HYPSUDRAFT_207063 [Hypholoma sublateritium FD-334 SS-4]